MGLRVVYYEASHDHASRRNSPEFHNCILWRATVRDGEVNQARFPIIAGQRLSLYRRQCNLLLHNGQYSAGADIRRPVSFRSFAPRRPALAGIAWRADSRVVYRPIHGPVFVPRWRAWQRANHLELGVRLRLQSGPDYTLRLGGALDIALQCDGGVGQYNRGQQYCSTDIASAHGNALAMARDIWQDLLARSTRHFADRLGQFHNGSLPRSRHLHSAQWRIVRQFQPADDNGTDQQYTNHRAGANFGIWRIDVWNDIMGA